MSGTWRELDQNNVYFSTARDAARFGLFNLARGTWDDQQILTETYFSQMTQTSQNQNPSYGFLWWLNGNGETVFPSSTVAVNRPVTLNAPDDMFSALGKNGQIIDVVPSENLVLVRLGGNPDDAEIPIVMHDELWEILSQIIN
ncbi:serine hydrolase domain-containing protein [Nonlabens agnitus]|nr:hypothetical protein [Nonlabens agnitus]